MRVTFISNEDAETPDYPCPVAVGDRIAASGTIAATNQGGGTELLKGFAKLEVEITKTFWDYECGWRMHARVVNEDDIDRVRQQTQSPYTEDWYRQNRPDDPQLEEHIARVRKAMAEYDPSKVFVSEHDLILSTRKRPQDGTTLAPRR